MITIKTEEEIEKMRKAGKTLAKILQAIQAHIKPNVKTAELDEVAENLANHQGQLHLPGLETLTDSPAHLALALRLPRNPGDVLRLDQLINLSERAAEILTEYPGDLHLNGLVKW